MHDLVRFPPGERVFVRDLSINHKKPSFANSPFLYCILSHEAGIESGYSFLVAKALTFREETAIRRKCWRLIRSINYVLSVKYGSIRCLSSGDSLPSDFSERSHGGAYTKPADYHKRSGQDPIELVHPVLIHVRADIYRFGCRNGYIFIAGFLFISFFLGIWGVRRIDDRRGDVLGWCTLSTATICWLLALFGGLFGFLPWDWNIPEEEQKKYGQSLAHVQTVTPKTLDMPAFLYYDKYMDNVLALKSRRCSI